jgi:hypothetical protein
MKKLILTSVVTFGLALGAFAQGQIILSSTSSYGLWDSVAGNYFSTAGNTPITVQVWVASDSSYVSAINSADAAGDILTASTLLTANYAMAGTYNTEAYYGSFMVGSSGKVTLTVPGLGGSPGSPEMTLAIAIWTGASTSLVDALNAGDMGGVISFQNLVGLGGTDALPSLTGWDGVGQNLTMGLVPEPTTIALGIMGLSTLLFRRRK